MLSLANMLSCTSALQQVADIYYHEKEYMGPAMWVFAKDGISWYQADGTLIKGKTFDSDHSCTSGCNFYDVATDGKNYVWAATMHTNSVSMYDIDTGDKIAEVGSCGTPLDVKFHPGREELWVRCADAKGDRGHVDVISMNSLHRQETTRMVTYDTSLYRNYGWLEVSSDLGNYGWTTQYNWPFLTQVDLSSSEVESIPLPIGMGAYVTAYSKVNKHLYLQNRVCCSCGLQSDTGVECSVYSPRLVKTVNVTTGVNKGLMNVQGLCGKECQGSKADPGIQEFDTVGKKFIQAINCDPDVGFGGTPLGSPSGDTILLNPFDGGKTVRVITPQKNGEKSTFDDAKLEFEDSGIATRPLTDAAFVEFEGVEAIIVASGSDNKLAIIDRATLKVSKKDISDRTEKTSNEDRQIHWAEGTPYVWITGDAIPEIYVFEMYLTNSKKRIKVRSVNLISDHASKLLWVENYGRKRDLDLLTAVYDEAMVKKSNKKSRNAIKDLLE